MLALKEWDWIEPKNNSQAFQKEDKIRWKTSTCSKIFTKVNKR